MRTFTLTCLLMLCFAFGEAQIQQASSLQDFAQVDRQQSSNDLIAGRKMNLNNIKGSPYFTENFQSAVVYDKSKNKKIKAYVRYRILDDMFEVRKKPRDQNTMTLKRGTNYKVKFNNQQYIFLENYPIKMSGTNSGYAMEMIKNENGANLYKRMTQTFNQNKRQQRSAYGSNNGRGKPSIDTETHYFVEIDNRLYHLGDSKKEVANAFPDHNSQVRNYIDNKNLRFRGDQKDSNYARLVNYYNTL